MGSGQSNEAKLFPPSLNPSYTCFPRTNNFTSTTTASSRSSTCTTPGITFHLLQPNHHLGARQGKGQGAIFHEQAMLGAGSSSTNAYSTTTTTNSRWNPTPEQLLALEEMYERGTRSPTADEIQQIASQLRRFGKIEGKNVFYWFQNHKARERQKRRREGENTGKVQKQDVEIPDRKESGMRSSTVHDEFLLTKNSVSSEGFVPLHRAAANKAENGTHGWSQFHQEIRESPQQKNTSPVNHDTWQNRFPSSSSSSASFSPPIFNESSFPSNPEFLTFERHECNFSNTLEVEAREIQTLQLFPLCGGANGDYNEGMVKCAKKDTKVPVTTINTNFSSSQFYEFLPLKN